MARGTLACVAISLIAAVGAVSARAADVPAGTPRPTHRWTGRLAAGDEHTCMIRDDASVWCWGDNRFGQLGNSANTKLKYAVPVQVSALPGSRVPVQIVAGANHTCVLADDGTVWCWGEGGFNQLNNSGQQSSDPVQVSFGTGVSATAVSAGGNVSCAFTTDRALTFWGQNTSGQIGNNTTKVSGGETSTAVSKIPSDFTARAVAPGTSHTCAVADNGAVWCWGLDDDLQLGSSANGALDSLVPAGTDSTGGWVTSVASGSAHSCVLRGNGIAVCWGSDVNGQLGRGQVNSTSPGVPTAVSLAASLTRLSAGGETVCGVSSQADLWCWGANGFGQTGKGSVSTAEPSALRVDAVNGSVVDVVVGASHTCLRLITEVITCVGKNDRGQLGTGDYLPRVVPTRVDGLDSSATAGNIETSSVTESAASVSFTIDVPVGESQFSVQRSQSAAFGAGTVTDELGTWGRVVAASRSTAHTCVVLAAGTVSCSGANSSGQLGSGTNTASESPVNVTGLGRATHISVGANHSCVVTILGTISCWGDNAEGQLGNGTTTSANSPVVTQLGAGVHVVEVAAGTQGTCAVLDSGGVKCWGANTHGELGNGGASGSTSPVTASMGSHEAVAVAMGESRACARTVTGIAMCWGRTPVGDGTSLDRNVPTAVSGLSDVRDIAVGSGHACAVRSTGAVVCWGDDETIHATVATSVSFGAGYFASRVAAAGEATCALLATGRIACIGESGPAQERATAQLDPSAVSSHASRQLTLRYSGLSDSTDYWVRVVSSHAGATTQSVATQFTTRAVTVVAPIVPGAPAPSGDTPSSGSPRSDLSGALTENPTTTQPGIELRIATTTVPSITTPHFATVRSPSSVLRTRAGRSLSASVLAKSVGLSIPRGSQGKLRLSIVSGASRCRFVGTTVRAQVSGRCTIRVVFIPTRGRITVRHATVVIAKKS